MHAAHLDIRQETSEPAAIEPPLPVQVPQEMPSPGRQDIPQLVPDGTEFLDLLVEAGHPVSDECFDDLLVAEMQKKQSAV